MSRRSKKITSVTLQCKTTSGKTELFSPWWLLYSYSSDNFIWHARTVVLNGSLRISFQW